MKTKKPSLAEVNPELAKEWHPTKNGELTPRDVTYGSAKKVWWKCSKGDDHEWKAIISSRVNGTGCPICSNQLIVTSNSLSTLNPELAKEWHPTKNGDLTPNKVGIGAKKKVWWKCSKGDDHEWTANISNRHRLKRDCPICSNHLIVTSNSLSTLNPELAKEWHPTKNGDLTPNKVGIGTTKKVWWKCSKGDDHEWEAKISSRVNGTGCPICSNHLIVTSNSLSTLNPELAKEWHPTKNGDLTPNKVGINTTKKVWWKCSKSDDHEWAANISNRHRLKRDCPICSNQLIVTSNSLSTLNPELAKEWHPTKNGDLTPNEVGIGARKKVWWKCSKGDDHEWESTIRGRQRAGCPCCSNKKVVQSNCLERTHPNIAMEWHPTKNGELTPRDVTSGTAKKIWWKCSKGDDHEWKAIISSRVNGTGCPVCSNNKVVQSNCLERTHPNIAMEWHPTKNGELTPRDVTSGSTKKIWWLCLKEENHIWEDKLINRKNGRTCPFCSIHSVSIQKRYPELAKQWDFEKNGEMTPLNTPFGYGKAVWWKCSKGDDHVWKATPNSRTKQKSGCSTGCPICSGRKVVSSNCLANTNPKLALEWNHLLNKKLTPYQVTSGSGKKVWWKCPKGNDHIWEATVLNRSNGLGCPFCTLTPQSKQELIITFELKQFFDINPKGFKTRVDGKLWSIDIYVPEINLGIEFDGSYWHKGKSELDKLKTKKLHQEGFHIIRVRQEPLKRIFDNDVMVRKKFDGKVIVNDILKQILKEHSLDSKIISKINKYLALDSIQNEKALDKYIDMILEEKAERKKSK